MQGPREPYTCRGIWFELTENLLSTVKPVNSNHIPLQVYGSRGRAGELLAGGVVIQQTPLEKNPDHKKGDALNEKSRSEGTPCSHTDPLVRAGPADSVVARGMVIAEIRFAVNSGVNSYP